MEKKKGSFNGKEFLCLRNKELTCMTLHQLQCKLFSSLWQFFFLKNKQKRLFQILSEKIRIFGTEIKRTKFEIIINCHFNFLIFHIFSFFFPFCSIFPKSRKKSQTKKKEKEKDSLQKKKKKKKKHLCKLLRQQFLFVECLDLIIISNEFSVDEQQWVMSLLSRLGKDGFLVCWGDIQINNVNFFKKRKRKVRREKKKERKKISIK